MPDFATKLSAIGAIKTGSFVLKGGLPSPIQIDLRLLVSHPQVLGEVARHLKLRTQHLSFDLVCGVPYFPIAMAAVFSQMTEIPMVIRRKESPKKPLEGAFEPGMKCLVLEDVVTSGSSLLETIKILEEGGIEVTDAFCLIDREQGGKEFLKKQGYHLQALYTLSELLDQLTRVHLLEPEKNSEIKAYLKKYPFQEP